MTTDPEMIAPLSEAMEQLDAVADGLALLEVALRGDGLSPAAQRAALDMVERIQEDLDGARTGVSVHLPSSTPNPAQAAGI